MAPTFQVTLIELAGLSPQEDLNPIPLTRYLTNSQELHLSSMQCVICAEGPCHCEEMATVLKQRILGPGHSQ